MHFKPLKAETGPRPKDWGRCFRVALVYPNSYRVGMGNLGLHAVYSAINGMDGMLADRFFVEPGKPGRQSRPASIEREMPVDHYDAVAFTAQFEADYPAIVSFLISAGMKTASIDRTDGDLYVIAGGPSISANPAPLSGFIDAIFVGEFEKGGSDLLARLRRNKSMGLERHEALDSLADLPHVYVPSSPRCALPVRASRPSLAGMSPPATVIHSTAAEFSDMHLVEFSRGCPSGCRFCMAGFTARPYRIFDEALITKAALGQRHRDKIGAVGELSAAHPAFASISSVIDKSGRRISPSSVRLDLMDQRFMEGIARSGQRTLTLAPETPSPRLSRAINKEFDEALFLDRIGATVAAGVENIRLYMMTGLPGETDEDTAMIAGLALKVLQIVCKVGGRSRLGKLTLSVNPFIPKPWTPLQWASMETPQEIARRFSIISDGLKGEPNLELKLASIDESVWEAALARADSTAAPILERAAKTGWRRTVKQEIADPSSPLLDWATRSRMADEIFPWEVVSHGCSREYLRLEYNRFLNAEPTPPCDPGTCRACGAC